MFKLYVNRAGLQPGTREKVWVVECKETGRKWRGDVVEILGPSKTKRIEACPTGCRGQAWVETRGPIKVDGTDI